VGLTIILFVAALSLGAITFWFMRAEVTEYQLENGRLLGRGAAGLLATATRGDTLDPGMVQRVVGSVPRNPAALDMDVVDGRLRVVGGRSARPGQILADPDLELALRTGEQVVRVREGEPYALAVSTPVVVEGQVRGAVRTVGALGLRPFEWPPLFWVLVAVDGGMLVLFITLVLTRYVVRPVVALERAALRVARGDLTVRLATDGAQEFASLAVSFNTMTSSVREQLERLDQQRQELQASREHLIRSEKLASVGRLAAGVAHEVGNPLQSIIGFTDVVLSGGIAQTEAQDFLERIRAEAQRIHRIIRELLDYARPVEDAVEPVALASVVEQSLQLVIPQRRLREVEVIRRGLDTVPTVAANGPRLVQVLVNLLLNAADALDGRGTVFIEGRAGVEPDRVELRVANTGPLIPPEDRGRIFDPFFTTKDPGQGTGLGLSVAQSIVESYGGRLTLADDESRTAFSIVLYRWTGP
jgi:signal transduction histidine kinase